MKLFSNSLFKLCNTKDVYWRIFPMHKTVVSIQNRSEFSTKSSWISNQINPYLNNWLALILSTSRLVHWKMKLLLSKKKWHLSKAKERSIATKQCVSSIRHMLISHKITHAQHIMSTNSNTSEWMLCRKTTERKKNTRILLWVFVCMSEWASKIQPGNKRSNTSAYNCGQERSKAHHRVAVRCMHVCLPIDDVIFQLFLVWCIFFVWVCM